MERQGRLFPCACTRRDLSPDGVYPGTCRDGLPADKKPRSLRVKAGDAYLGFTDALQGDFAQRLDSEVGDFVVRRADGLTAYHLAVVVDDAAQGISEVD